MFKAKTTLMLTQCLIAMISMVLLTAAQVDAQAAPVAPESLNERIAAASPGDTIVIDGGVYKERLRIDKSLVIEGRNGAVIDGGGAGDIIEVVAPDVTIRGLTIRNTGSDLDKENAAIRILSPRITLERNTLEDVLFGIDLRDAPGSRIISNTVGGKRLDIARRGDGLRLWRSDGAVLESNTFHDGRDAILWYSKDVVVRGNTATRCRYGLHLMFSDGVTIEDNELIGNSVGIYIMYSTGITISRNRLLRNRGPSGYGIGLKEADHFVVRENLLAGNRSGVYVDGSPFTHQVPGVFTLNTIALNDIGMTFLPSARGNEVTQNNFIDNVDQVAVAGRGSLDGNRFWKGDVGNYWSDYTGYDENEDGIGDFVHESQTLFENLLDRRPELRLFLYSPAQQAIEFVGRALPAIRPEPKFTDEVPLMRPIPAAAIDRRRERGAMMVAGGVLMLLGGSLIGVTAPWRDLCRQGERACWR